MIRLWTRLGRPGRARLVIAFTLAAAAGAMSALLLGVSGWFLTASAVAGVSGAGMVFNHLYPSATVRGAAMGRIIARYGEQLVGHDATLTMSAVLRRRLFETTARATPGLARPDSDSLSIFIDDVQKAEGALLRLALPLAGAIAASIVALVFAALTGIAALAAVAAGLTLACMLGGTAGIRAQREADTRLRALSDSFRRDAGSLVESRIELEALGRFATTASALGALAEKHARQTVAAGRGPRRIAALGGGIGALSALAAVALGSAGSAGVAMLAGTALATLAAHQALSAFLGALAGYPATALALTRIDTRLGAAPAIAEPATPTTPAPDDILPVALNSLTVGITPGIPLVQPLTLTLEPGSIVEFVGPSGTGKTTLLETLARLREPCTGEISFAGIAAGSIRSALVRQHIGLAPQHPDVMAGTLRDALRLAKPDATDADMAKACRIAAFAPVVARSPLGLDRPVAAGGTDLSGGEMRRFAIARALLRNPRLLLLDEPFAGLDTTTRTDLVQGLAVWAAENRAAICLVTHAPDAQAWSGLAYSRCILKRRA